MLTQERPESHIDFTVVERPPLPECIDIRHRDLWDYIHGAGAPEFHDRDAMDKVSLEPKPDLTVGDINREFAEQVNKPGFSVRDFVDAHFDWPVRADGAAAKFNGRMTHRNLNRHAKAVFRSLLGRAVDGPTTIGMDNEVAQPGGRYSDNRRGDESAGNHAKGWYWDTMCASAGLAAVDMWKKAAGLAKNLRSQIIRFQRPPLLSNSPEYEGSQPPIYSRLVRKDVEREGPVAYERHLPAMLIEYWSLMEGYDDPTKLGLEPGSRYKSVVRMPDGSVMNVFWAPGFTYPDGTPRPRPEMPEADKKTKRELEALLGLKEHFGVEELNRLKKERDIDQLIELASELGIKRELTPEEETNLYEEIRAGVAAGTDFADWMLEDGENLATIRVTRRVPPFLNALLFELECTIAEAYLDLAKRDTPGALQKAEFYKEAQFYAKQAGNRAVSFNKFLLHKKLGYVPYDLDTGQLEEPFLQDATFALESGIHGAEEHAALVMEVLEELLAVGGLRTSRRNTKQSWGGDNIWPILQRGGARCAWLTGYESLRRRITGAFLRNVHAGLRKTGYGLERYHATNLGEPGIGGEYKVPAANFFWTSAVEVDLRTEAYTKSEADRQFWERCNLLARLACGHSVAPPAEARDKATAKTRTNREQYN